MAEAILEARGLRKAFGALAATDGVDLELREGETHAIIGPNGAGKTTLIGQLSGTLRPDSGQIRFAGEDVTRLTAPQRAKKGFARSFQITSIYRDFTALDNVALAVQAHAGHSFRFWKPAREEHALRDPARAVLDEVGLGERAGVLAANLAHGEQRQLDNVALAVQAHAGHSFRFWKPAREEHALRDPARAVLDAGALAANLAHGEQRQLEVAMALATKPRLLLLDEPVAGMGLEESQRMVQFLAGLKGRQSIILVEHDMDAVFTLADRISVLVYGRIIASGRPEEVRANAEVRRAYLGEES